MKVIVDAMGGDHAPNTVVEGAVAAASEDCRVVLVGDENRVNQILSGRKNAFIEVVHASEVIDMHDKPSTAVRVKKDSSMAVALRLLNEGAGDALVSAGSTGALLTGATLVTGRIKGIRRPSLAPLLPQKNGGYALLIDSGANPVCTAENLLQFAYMGYFFMKTQQNISSPRVGLLNNGTEEGKGDELRQEAYALLDEAGKSGRIRFVGNVEARDALMGVCDVLVCDGFSGNVLLKSIEGAAAFIMGELKGVVLESPFTKLCAAGLKPGLRRMKAKLDYKEVGGAPFLGVMKPVVKAHGSSDGRAFERAIMQAAAFASCGFIEQVSENVEYMKTTKTSEE